MLLDTKWLGGIGHLGNKAMAKIPDYEPYYSYYVLYFTPVYMEKVFNPIKHGGIGGYIAL